MDISFFHIPSGLTAIVGSGGKTTLMDLLVHDLPGLNIMSTSTHIYPPVHLPAADPRDPAGLAGLLRGRKAVCLGRREGSKLTAPTLPFAQMLPLCDHVLVEADGSRGLPLKAHLVHEPVIPPEAVHTILVVGLSGLGRPVSEAAHRPERFAELADCAQSDPVTPEMLARVIRGEAVCDCVLLNQAEGRLEEAVRIAGLLPYPCAAAELQKEWIKCLS